MKDEIARTLSREPNEPTPAGYASTDTARVRVISPTREPNFLSLFQSVYDAALIADGTGSIIEANSRAGEFFRVDASEMIGQPVHSLLVEAGTDLMEMLAATLSATRFVLMEAHCLRSDGSTFPSEVAVHPLRVSKRDYVCFFVRNITARVEAQEALAENEDRVRRQQQSLSRLVRFRKGRPPDLQEAAAAVTEEGAAALGVARCSLWLFADDGKRLKCVDLYDARTETHTGGMCLSVADCPVYLAALSDEHTLCADDVQQDPRTRGFAPRYIAAAGIASKLDAAVQVGGDTLGVLCLEHVGGSRAWHRDEQGYASSLADMLALTLEGAKRLEAQEERRDLEAQVRHQQKQDAIGTLAAGVAHEINNPINGIINLAQLLEDRLPDGDSLAELTAEIRHEGERVAQIVRGLLAFSRGDTGEPTHCTVEDLLDGVIPLINTVTRGDQVVIEQEIPDGLPSVHCREQEIQQVLINLINNARDALNERYPGHDPDKLIRLTASLREGDGGTPCVDLVVEDHGCGMDEDVLARLFDPFYTTKSRSERTGLGLTISQQIARDHDGDIFAESTPGEGTRLHLILPVGSE